MNFGYEIAYSCLITPAIVVLSKQSFFIYKSQLVWISSKLLICSTRKGTSTIYPQRNIHSIIKRFQSKMPRERFPKYLKANQTCKSL